jgi:NADH-quinone oxidoreductase subunit J
MQDLVFYFFAAIAIAASFGVSASKNPLTSAIYLLLALFAVAALFAWAGAHFLAAMQVLVYAGAVAVLFVFVIMLLNLSDRELGTFRFSIAHALGLVFVLVILFAISATATGAASSFPFANGDPGSVKEIGKELLTKYIAPFEIISLLLLTSMAGAVMLTKRAHGADDAIASINKVRETIDRLSHRAFAPDPSLPFQQGPPRRQEIPSGNAPSEGFDRNVPLDPGETV